MVPMGSRSKYLFGRSCLIQAYSTKKRTIKEVSTRVCLYLSECDRVGSGSGCRALVVDS